MNIKILPLSSQVIEEVVDIHIRTFPGFFLTFLGPRFLRVFYSSLVNEPEGIGFVAKDSETEQIVGIVSGVITPQGFFKRLFKRRWLAFGLASIDAVFRRPTIVLRLFSALFFRGEPPEEAHKRSLLCSIAVLPEARGHKIGRNLMDRWLEEIKRCGSIGAYLKTDRENNDSVNRFYLNYGWKLESIFQTSQGRSMNRYIYDF